MSLSHWMTITILTALPLAVVAQENPNRSIPDSPAEVVPAPAYESAFSHYQASSEFKDSLDKIWRSVNDELGHADSHAAQARETPAVPDSRARAAATSSGPMTKETQAFEPKSANHVQHHQHESK